MNLKACVYERLREPNENRSANKARVAEQKREHKTYAAPTAEEHKAKHMVPSTEQVK